MGTIPWLAVAVLAAAVAAASSGVAASYAQSVQCDLDQGMVVVAGVCVKAGGEREPNLQIDTSSEEYGNGDRVAITGKVKKSGGDLANAVTFIVTDPSNNIVHVGQVMPSADGSFTYNKILATGPKWKDAGTYQVVASYGGSFKSTISFAYTGGGSAPPPSEKPPEADRTPPPPPEPVELGIAPFVEDDKDPQYYVDRYVNEPEFKKWFDDNFSEYDSIYHAVGMSEPPPPPPPAPPAEVKEPEKPEPEPPKCGPGTEPDEDGICQLVPQKPEPAPAPPADDRRSGCLIATAAYGSELAPQVQMLREIRDGTLYSTASGASFMAGFNQVYYLFSPTIADWERQNPAFKGAVQAAITPMLSSLGVMALADPGSEYQVLGYGISVIALNLGMYVAAPAGAAALAARGLRKARAG